MLTNIFKLMKDSKQALVASLILLVGLISVFSGLKTCMPLDYFNILNYSLRFSLPLVLLFIIFSAKFFKREGPSKRVFIYSSIFSVAAFVLTSLGIVTFLNAVAHPGQPVTHSMKVIGKYRCSSSSETLCAHVESWRSPGKREIIHLLESDEEKVIPNAKLDIITRPGGFDFECLDSYHAR